MKTSLIGTQFLSDKNDKSNAKAASIGAYLLAHLIGTENW